MCGGRNIWCCCVVWMRIGLFRRLLFGVRCCRIVVMCLGVWLWLVIMIGLVRV